MSVLLDDLYLENIEEYVKDEKRIVTCKWLSRKLSVPMNAAKKMLYHYVSQQTTPNSLSVLYCVTGRKKSDESDEADIVVQLVTDDQLDDFKRQLCEVWTMHVYSVQMSQIKESAILYSSDYQTLRDYCGEYNKWNPISCDIMSCDSCTPAAVPQREPSVPNVWSSETCKETVLAEKSTNKGKETHLTNIKNNSQIAKKKQQQSSSSKGSSFFSKNPSKSSDNGNSSASVKVNKPSTFIDQAKKEAEKNKDTQKLEAVAEEDKTKIEKKSTYSGLHDSDFEDEGSSNEEPLVKNKIIDKKPTRSTKTTKSKTSKKSQQQPSSSTATDRNDTQETNKKKRRRVQELSSDEEENLAIPEKSNKLASSSTTEKNNTTRKRKVKRKLVSKTFLDEDGSMVTQKEWEEVSTDASSDGDDKTMATTVGCKKQSNVDIQSPSKRTKQSRLTSFFKK